MVQDPWTIHDSKYTESPPRATANTEPQCTSFEDNFHPTASAVNTKLPDTDEYLQSLGKRCLISLAQKYTQKI